MTLPPQSHSPPPSPPKPTQALPSLPSLPSRPSWPSLQNPSSSFLAVQRYAPPAGQVPPRPPRPPGLSSQPQACQAQALPGVLGEKSWDLLPSCLAVACVDDARSSPQNAPAIGNGNIRNQRPEWSFGVVKHGDPSTRPGPTGVPRGHDFRPSPSLQHGSLAPLFAATGVRVYTKGTE